MRMSQDFKGLIKETTGRDLTDQEAWERATELIARYRMFLGPHPGRSGGEPFARPRDPMETRGVTYPPR